jgi:hypothetical protein
MFTVVTVCADRVAARHGFSIEKLQTHRLESDGKLDGPGPANTIEAEAGFNHEMMEAEPLPL